MWSPKRKIGNIGEDEVCKFLKKEGFEIVERNHLQRWGELDIVAKKGGVIHIIEVKSVSGAVENIRPEENLHYGKIAKLRRVIQTYLVNMPENTKWQFDLACVYLGKGKSKIKMMWNVIL